LYSQPRNLTATLAPLVTECAEEGDTVAVEILSETAGKLAWYVQGVHRNLFGGLEHIPVAHIGGVFQSEPLRKLFSTFLRDTIGCPVLYPKFSPAAGALLEALYLDDNSAILTGIPETKT
jgi:N-acetylglucosamine kinase-like BadF-type ATPase